MKKMFFLLCLLSTNVFGQSVYLNVINDPLVYDVVTAGSSVTYNGSTGTVTFAPTAYYTGNAGDPEELTISSNDYSFALSQGGDYWDFANWPLSLTNDTVYIGNIEEVPWRFNTTFTVDGVSETFDVYIPSGGPGQSFTSPPYTEPTNSYPVGFSTSYSIASVIGGVYSNDLPVIYEWTRQADAGDTIAFTGENIDGDTDFFTMGVTHASQIIRLSEPQLIGTNQFAITVLCGAGLSDLNPGMFFVWPRNGTNYGAPIAINQTEAWWVGPDKVATNETFSVYGRNLELGDDGLTQLWIDGHGWVTNTAANPYKVDFVCPPLSTGTHTGYVHNGHGGKYGWADALTLEVAADTGWNDATNTWINSSGYANINAAVSAADATNWSTVYIPGAANSVSTKINLSGVDYVRIAGDGKDSTTLTTSGITQIAAGTGLNYIEFQGLTLEASSSVNDDLVDLRGDNIVFDDVRIDNSDATVAYGVSHLAGSANRPLKIEQSSYLTFTNCEFVVKSTMSIYYCDNVFFDNCVFKGRNDAARLLTFYYETEKISITGCTFQNYDYATYLTDAMSRCYGRCVNIGKRFENGYFGGNTTTNMAPWYDNPASYADKNVGEHFMWEVGRDAIDSDIESSTSNTVTVASVGTATTNMFIQIESGTGAGQVRKITDISGSIITVDENWRVNPDSGSDFVAGDFARQIAVYNNAMDGIDGKNNYSISSGVYNYVNSMGVHAFMPTTDLVVDSNTFSDFAQAVHIAATDEGITAFNLSMNNTIDNCRHAVNVESHRLGANFCNVFRNATVSNTNDEDYRFRRNSNSPSAGVLIRSTIFQDHIPAPVDFTYGYITTDQIENSIFITDGEAWSP